MNLLSLVVRAALLLLAALTPLATSSAAEPELPNIILAMADDQGYGDVAYYGHPKLKTPVMDEMAASGLRFDRFYAACPVCSPTRGSVMTGRHPNRFGCFQWGHVLRPQEVTVAEALKQAGYATGHFGKWHLGTMVAGMPTSPGESGFDTWVSSPNFYENNPLFSHNGKVIQTQGESSQVTVDAAIEFIRSAVDKKQPFLAVVWFGNPHTPHVATEELQALYPDCTKAEQNYYGEITGIDRSLGVLRKELRTLGITDNTLFWYTSDNGAQGRNGPPSTGGLAGSKGTLWEGGVRVPGIIEWPARIPKPRVTAVPANTIDIYPTLLELTGVEISKQPPLDGISLVKLIDGQMESRDKPMGFWDYPIGGRGRRSGELLKAQADGKDDGSQDAKMAEISKKMELSDRKGELAWIDGDWKILNLGGKNAGFKLFNLEDDPQEKKDLAKEQPERLAQMQKALDAWCESVVRSFNGEDY